MHSSQQYSRFSECLQGVESNHNIFGILILAILTAEDIKKESLFAETRQGTTVTNDNFLQELQPEALCHKVFSNSKFRLQEIIL